MTEQTDTRTRRARRLSRTRGRPQPKPAPPTDPTLDTLRIPVRYHDELMAAGIERLSQLRAYGDLTRIKGIGPKSAREIEQAIAGWQSP